MADPAKTVQEGYTLYAGSGIDSMGIPYYMTQLNEFVRDFSEMFNEIESTGKNLNGDTPPQFFEASQLQERYMIFPTAAYTETLLLARLQR